MIIGKSLTALGGGGLKPEIHVTAKAGALLNLHYKDNSIILQSYQLEAEETQHTFVVDVSETAYVVDDATNSKSVEVLVDAVAVFDVEIEYVTYLYKEGDERTDITGGWVTCDAISEYSIGTNTKNSDNLYAKVVASSKQQCAGFRTVNKINFSNFNKLHFMVSSVSYSSADYVNIGMSYSSSDTTCQTWGIREDAIVVGDNVMDISSTTSSYYVKFGMWAWDRLNHYASLSITKIWLE